MITIILGRRLRGDASCYGSELQVGLHHPHRCNHHHQHHHCSDDHLHHLHDDNRGICTFPDLSSSEEQENSLEWLPWTNLKEVKIIIKKEPNANSQ